MKQDFAVRIFDFRLATPRTIPVGFHELDDDYNFTEFVDIGDFPIKKRHLRKVADQLITRKPSLSPAKLIGIYSHTLNGDMMIEVLGTAYNQTKNRFKINLGCLSGEKEGHQVSQRLILLAAELPEEAKLKIVMHHQDESDPRDSAFKKEKKAVIRRFDMPVVVGSPSIPVPKFSEFDLATRLSKHAR